MTGTAKIIRTSTVILLRSHCSRFKESRIVQIDGLSQVLHETTYRSGQQGIDRILERYFNIAESMPVEPSCLVVVGPDNSVKEDQEVSPGAQNDQGNNCDVLDSDE